MTCFTSSGLRPGRACRSRAATPETCGVAMLVPDSAAVAPGCSLGSRMPMPVGVPDDTTPTPGAVTSGW